MARPAINYGGTWYSIHGGRGGETPLPQFVYLNRCTPPPLIPIVLNGGRAERGRERTEPVAFIHDTIGAFTYVHVRKGNGTVASRAAPSSVGPCMKSDVIPVHLAGYGCATRNYPTPLPMPPLKFFIPRGRRLGITREIHRDPAELFVPTVYLNVINGLSHSLVIRYIDVECNVRSGRTKFRSICRLYARANLTGGNNAERLKSLLRGTLCKTLFYTKFCYIQRSIFVRPVLASKIEVAFNGNTGYIEISTLRIIAK